MSEEPKSYDFNSISGKDYSFLDLSFLDLSNVVLDGFDLRGASFFCAKLDGCIIRNSDLRDTDFIGAHLNQAKFENTIIKDTDFSFAISNKLSIVRSRTHEFIRLYSRLKVEISEDEVGLVISIPEELKSFRVTGQPLGTFELK